MTISRRRLRLTAANTLLAAACLLTSSAWAATSVDETAVAAVEDDARSERILEEARSGPDGRYAWFGDTIAIEEIERTETAIRRLSDLVRTTPASNLQRADYMFRLAELYTDRTRFYEQRAYQRRDEAFVVEPENPQRAEAYRRAAEGDLEQSERFARDAATLYGDLYQTYRGSFAEMDAVLFYLGSNFLQYNQRAAAAQIYEELARSYPTSAFLSQAMLMLGEISFEDGDLEAAIAYYDIVIQTPESAAYPYGLYKKSWALYNQAHNRRQFVAALETLYSAVEASREREAQGSRALSLTRQALRDVPLFYSEVYEGRVAPAFFDRIAEDQAQDLLERLGRIYADKAAYGDSNAVYRALIARNPESFRTVMWQAEIVDNTRPSAGEVETVREIRRLVGLYNTAQDYEDATPALISETAEKIEHMLRSVATTYHREAQVTKNEHFYALAYNLYEDYIATFPEGNEAYTMWYYYAELLYRNEDWVVAADAYERVLALGEGEGEHDEDATHRTCLAYTKMVDLSRSTEGSDGTAMQQEDDLPPIPEPEEIPAEYQRMMSACDRYLEHTTDPELAAELDYVVAYVYYDYNHLDEAVRRFGEFALERSDADFERASASAELVLDSLALQRKWGEMREWITRLQASRVNRGELATRLTALREQVSFKECRDMQQEDDFNGAAYCFFNFVNDNSDSQYVDRAILNAAISFREIDNLDYSISLLEQLPVLAPDSDLVPTTLYELGYSFHRLAIYETAAEYYEAYVAAEPNGEHAFDAMINAAQFRQGLGQYRAAIDATNRVSRIAARDPEKGTDVVAEAAFQVARIRDMRGDGSDAIREYDRFVRNHGNVLPSRAVEAMVRQGDMYLDRRNEPRGYGRYQDAVRYVADLDAEARGKLTHAALDAVSRAQFLLADRSYDAFVGVSLQRRTEAQIRAAVEEKLAMGLEAAQAFEPVIRTYSRPGWMIAALTRLGQMRHVFFEQLIDAPVPPGLDPLVEEVYRTELETRAAEIRDEAIGYYAQAIIVSREHAWFNEYSELAARRLQALDPSFASGSEIRIAPGFDSARPYVSEFAGARERLRETQQTDDPQEETTVPSANPGAEQ